MYFKNSYKYELIVSYLGNNIHIYEFNILKVLHLLINISKVFLYLFDYYNSKNL